jgi:hypothetical protein
MRQFSRMTCGAGAFRSTKVLAVVAGLAAIAGGCGSPPKGDAGGRIGGDVTTEADRRSSGANIPSMLEFSDRVVEQLAQDVSEMPEIRDAPTKVVLVLGDLQNKTATPTTDFELLGRRIRANINTSRFFRDRFMIVEDRARAERLRDRVVAPERPRASLDDKPKAQGGVAGYDEEITYTLNGDFIEANRGNRRQYFFNFSLMQLSTGRVVFEKPYDLGQVGG